MSAESLRRIISEFQAETEKVSDEDLPDITEKYVEPILESLSDNSVCVEDTDDYLEIAASVYERSEGDVFQIADILERAAFFIETDNARGILIGCMGLSASGLYLSTNPEEYGLVFDLLCSISLTAIDYDESLKCVVDALAQLREDFNGICRSTDDDTFFAVVEHLENDEEGDVPASLRDLFISMSDGRDDSPVLERLFIERFFEI